ncbi:trypsin-like peptidase domain-containing protein [Paenibacillus sp. J5C_2022]|uniref:S1C family serine protease n=1 Tax=Paenibacillus sp. J5C2022 TaxID=2977129 RepID=UPI0021D1D792|nr:trypsin-like peptidase domain-containing protein [Paenibacillus sp. J5C2022]MCU6709761.1 trypsin-like peptidase domain-containing protein [Paenibacillus sp. J5C2022]
MSSYNHNTTDSNQNYNQHDSKDSNHSWNEAIKPTGKPLFDAYYRELGQQRQTSKKKKSSSVSLFAAFLAGAIVFGGFAYASDRVNLFTGSTGGRGSNGQGGSSGYSEDAGLQTASAPLQAKSDLAAVYEEALPGVVKIESYSAMNRGGMTEADMLRYFFGGGTAGREDARTSEGELVKNGEGTGFFVDEDGYIMTNQHVVADAQQVMVTVHGQEEPLQADVLWSSEEQDLALLKVSSSNGDKFHALELGDSDQVNIGDWVLAIGNPYGYEGTLTIGVLSAKERPITIQGEDGVVHTHEHMLQTDASINPGNSGGPLLNSAGEVVGINSAVNAEAQGIGFAIPTSVVKELMQQYSSKMM